MSAITKLFGIALVLFASSCSPYKTVVKTKGYTEGLFAAVKTTRGNIYIKLEYDKAPLTVSSFVGLAEGSVSNKVKKPGEPYYDGLTFHRVEENFVIQGGDPMANGKGGPGFTFRQEIHPKLKHDSAGVVAMANIGPNTNGSQFYITRKPLEFFDGHYNVFGSVIEGMSVVKKIELGDRIEEVRIIRLGSSAKQFKARATFERLK